MREQALLMCVCSALSHLIAERMLQLWEGDYCNLNFKDEDWDVDVLFCVYFLGADSRCGCARMACLEDVVVTQVWARVHLEALLAEVQERTGTPVSGDCVNRETCEWCVLVRGQVLRPNWEQTPCKWGEVSSLFSYEGIRWKTPCK